MWCFVKLALLIPPILGDVLEEEAITTRSSSESDSRSDSDSDHEWPDPWPIPTPDPDPFSSDSEWELPTFQPITFYPPTDSDSSSDSSSDESDSEDEQINEGEVCEIPIISGGHGYLMDTTRPIKVGEVRKIRCKAGYCLSDAKDKNQPAKLTTFNCTEKMARDDVYCGLPECVKDMCTDDSVLCDDGRDLCNENKVVVVKGFLKEGHASLKMNWYSQYEKQAERYLKSSKGYEGAEVLKFQGVGLCNRHLAPGYFNIWGAYLRQKYYGGWVGCAVSRDWRNFIACIVYKANNRI